MEIILDFLRKDLYRAILVGLVIVLLVVFLLGHVTSGDRSVLQVPSDLASLSVEEQERINQEVVLAISEIMILPSNDAPIIASVTNSGTLREQQPFYAKVQDGDVLAIFESSRQAIIYRPSEWKVVNAGPLIIDENAAQ